MIYWQLFLSFLQIIVDRLTNFPVIIKNSIQIRNPVNQPGRTGTLRTGEIIVIKNLKIIIYFRFIGTGKFSKIKTKIKFLCIQILHKRYRYNDSPVCSQGIIEA